MNNNKLLLMAESILNNFSAYPDEYQVNKTVDHIRNFWTPVMQRQLKESFQDVSQSHPEKLVQAVNKL